MALKPGSVADFAGSLAEAMEIAMNQEWQAVKGVPLPELGVDDRRLLLVAISRGLFQFLKANENDFINKAKLHDPIGGVIDIDYDVVQLELNL